MSSFSNTNKDKALSLALSKEKVQGKYLYCIIKAKQPHKFKLKGIEGTDVYTIPAGELSAVVSDSEIKEYLLTRENALAHQEVIEQVMKEGYDVLPFGFSIVVKATKDLKEKILESKKEELLATFKKVEGKVELGFKALWQDMASIFQEILAENKEIQVAKRQAQKTLNQFKVAAVGELVAKCLEQKREKEAQKILKPLQELASDFEGKEIRGDSMICSSAFLVSKKNEKRFDKEVEALTEKLGKRIKFLYIGPIPPFSFIDLHLKTS